MALRGQEDLPSVVGDLRRVGPESDCRRQMHQQPVFERKPEGPVRRFDHPAFETRGHACLEASGRVCERKQPLVEESVQCRRQREAVRDVIGALERNGANVRGIEDSSGLIGSNRPDLETADRAAVLVGSKNVPAELGVAFEDLHYSTGSLRSEDAWCFVLSALGVVDLSIGDLEGADVLTASPEDPDHVTGSDRSHRPTEGGDVP